MCSVAVARRPVEPEVRVQLPAYDLKVYLKPMED